MKKISKNNQSKAAQSRPEPPGDGKRPPIDLALRRKNRALETERVLALLRKDAPQFFEQAEVVGTWVWIQFPDKQSAEMTTQLSQLGFHWNNLRQAWQHPCGTIRENRENFDPRKHYRAQPAGERIAA